MYRQGMFRNTFWAGVRAFFPVALTLVICGWVIVSIETYFGWLLKFLIPEEHYHRGMGTAAGILLVFCIGIAMQTYLAQRIYSLGEKILRRIPLIKTVYNSLMDFMAFFEPESTRKGRVVLADMPQGLVIGICTREDVHKISRELDQDDIAVYLPMSYQMGGYTVFIPKDRVKPIDIPVEEAMRFVLTAGLSGQKSK